jgi:hypothetical protein
LNLVVRRVPRYGHRQRTVHHPKNRREKTSQIRSGQPPDNGADEDEIRELSEKYERTEGQGIHAEQLVEAHIKEPFSKPADSSLRQQERAPHGETSANREPASAIRATQNRPVGTRR